MSIFHSPGKKYFKMKNIMGVRLYEDRPYLLRYPSLAIIRFGVWKKMNVLSLSLMLVDEQKTVVNNCFLKLQTPHRRIKRLKEVKKRNAKECMKNINILPKLSLHFLCTEQKCC